MPQDNEKKSTEQKEVIEEYQFTEIEHRIVGLLYAVRAPMTAYEIKTRLEISFDTAKKYLDRLYDSGVVIILVTKTPKGEKQRYKFNFNEYELSPERKQELRR